MLTILRALESPVIESLGWALVHFVWQAALLALLLAALLVPFQRTAARARYLVQCAMLIVMALCPAVTWWRIASTAKPNEVAMVTRDKPVAPSEQPILNDEPVLGPMVTGSVGLDGPINSDSTMVAPAMNAIAPRANRVELPSPDRAVSWNERVRRGVAPVLPWLVGAWLFGVVVLSLRLLVGWQIVQRLKRLAVTPAAEAWQLRLKALAARLGVTRTIKLVESALIEVPTVIGWIRPVILLPVSVLTNLTPQQLEAVLAHELAHIRRHDYLVNLIQTAIETLLFYHPAVWWLSRLIRHEREHCCDDLALGLCDNPVTYVSALAAMEELRASPALTVAASGGSLLSRIRRIALGPVIDTRRSAWWGASLIVLTTLVGLGLTTYIVSHASDDSSPTPGNKSLTTEPTAEATENAEQSLEPIPEVRVGKLPSEAIDGSDAAPSDELEFLKQYRKSHTSLQALSLDMTEGRFKAMMRGCGIPMQTTRGGGGKVAYTIQTGDEQDIFAKFDDGKCGGIQLIPRATWPKQTSFESLSVAFKNSFGSRQAERIVIKGNGDCLYQIDELPTLGTNPKRTGARINSKIHPQRMLELERLLAETDWLANKPEEVPGPPLHTDETPLTVVRGGVTTTAKCFAPRDAAYRTLLWLLRGTAKQEQFVYAIDWVADNATERNLALIEIRFDIEALEGRPGRALPPFDYDYLRLLPTFSRMLRNPNEQEEPLLTAIKVASFVREDDEFDFIARWRHDRSSNIRNAVATAITDSAMGDFGGERALALLVEMVSSTEEARRGLIRFGDYGIPTVVKLIEPGSTASDIVSEQMVRAYLDHRKELTGPLDARLIAAVRQALAATKARPSQRTEYYEEFLKWAEQQPTKAPPAVPLPERNVVPPLPGRNERGADTGKPTAQVDEGRPAGLIGRLPHGRKLELVGVAHAVVAGLNRTERKEYGWWQANGTKLDKEPFALGLVSIPPSKQPLRELAFRWETRPKELASPEQAKLTPMHGSLWFGSLRGPHPTVESWDPSGFMHYQVALPFESEQPGAMAFYYSDDFVIEAGVLGLDGKIEPGTNATARTKSLLQFVDVAGIEKSATETIVTLRPSVHRWPMQVFLFAISPDGTRIHPTNPATPDDRDRLVFKVPAAETEGFQINLRPMTHRIVIENIALRPGQKTEPKLTVDPLDALVSVKFRKDGKTLGRIGEIRLSQLEEMLKDMQHDLNSETGELIVGSHSAASFEAAERIVAKLKAGVWKWPTITVTQQSPFVDALKENAATETSPPDGLEFLKPYPMLHGLSLDMTEPQFLEIVKQQELKTKKHGEGDTTAYHIGLGDGLTLIVMFRKDGTCRGIQRIRGEDEKVDERGAATTLPQSNKSQLLFKTWLRAARGNGNIPGGTIGPLVRVMTNFVKNNPTHEGAPKFAELLKRMDGTRDWSRDEAVKLLDEVAAIYPSLPEWVEGENRFRLGGDVVVGKPLPEELKAAPWGEAQANGLRVAWLLEPPQLGAMKPAEYRLNTPLKSRMLFHNSGKNAVVFRALTWNQSGGHKARDAQGNEININSTDWTTIPRKFACRLAPGEFLEVVGAGIGVGANKDDEDWRDARSDFRVGSWIRAKAGDEVTFLPDGIDCDGRHAPQPEGDDAQAAPQTWWLKFIKDRLSLDAPLPADADERGRLLDRAIRDLFGNAPTAAELTAFKNDATPGALEALAKRLAERSGCESFSGSLTSGSTKFKVLPVDPDAAKKPRTAKGPGQYSLLNATFVVTRRPIGERIVNEAHLSFSSTEARKPAPKSHPVLLPDDYDSWIAAWMRGGTVLWIAQKGAAQKESIRRYDFTDPASVAESVINELKPSEKLPQAVLDALVTRPQAVQGNEQGRNRPTNDTKLIAEYPRVFRGKVTNAAGKPVAGALIEWGPDYPHDAPRDSVRSADDGTYRLEVMKAGGKFTLGFSAPGNAPLIFKGLIPGPKSEPTQLDAKLPAETTLQIAIVDESKQPIPNLEVLPMTPQRGFNSSFSMVEQPEPIPGHGRPMTCDAQGVCLLKQLLAAPEPLLKAEATDTPAQAEFKQRTNQEGWLSMRITHGGKWVHEHSVSRQEFFESKGVVQIVVPDYRNPLKESLKNGTIFGQVVDAEGKPVPNYHVTLRHRPESKAVSDTEGRFEWGDKLDPANRYEVRIFAKGFAPQTVRIAPKETQRTQPLHIELKPHVSAEFVLLDAETQKPIPKVVVVAAVAKQEGRNYIEWNNLGSYADGHHGLTNVVRITTDAEGRFSVPEGDTAATLLILTPGYARTIVTPQQRSARDGKGPMPLALPRGASIHGVAVKNSRLSQRASGVSLNANAVNDFEQMFHGLKRDANGECDIESLAAGDYYISLVHSDGNMSTACWHKKITLKPGEKKLVPLGEMTGTLTLSGRTSPFTDVALTRKRAGAAANKDVVPDGVLSVATISDVDGNFELDQLEAGSYSIEVGRLQRFGGRSFLIENKGPKEIELVKDTHIDFVTPKDKPVGKLPQADQGNAAEKTQSEALKVMVADLMKLLPQHWHPQFVSERTIEMMPGMYTTSEHRPHVVLVFTDDKTRPAMKWERKDGQYEYLGETPHGHGHLFVSMKITGEAAKPELMKFFDWPEASDFVKAFLKRDHAKLAALKEIADNREWSRNDWGPIKNGIRSHWIPYSKEFVVGKPITVGLELYNFDPEPRTFSIRQAHPWRSWEVIGPDGKPVAFRPGKPITIDESSTLQTTSSMMLFGGTDLAQLFDLARPGRYTLQFNGQAVRDVPDELKLDIPANRSLPAAKDWTFQINEPRDLAADGLEFLKPYPKLHGLSLDMTEPQFLEIVKQSGLKAKQVVDGDKGHHYLVLLGDGHTLIVMFDKDGKCSGIQRVRGEEDVSAPPQAVRGNVKAKDETTVSLTAAELEKRIQLSGRELFFGRMELAQEFEMVWPTKDQKLEKVTSKGTVRWLKKGGMTRIESDRTVPGTGTTDMQPEQWTTGQDGDRAYSWDRVAKSIRYGALRPGAIAYAPNLFFWGRSAIAFPQPMFGPNPKLTQTTRDDREEIDVIMVIPDSKTSVHYVGIVPDRGYLPTRVETRTNDRLDSQIEFQDFFQPRPGVWAAKTILWTAWSADNDANGKPIVSMSSKMTVTRLELGDDAKLQDDEFKLKLPDEVKVVDAATANAAATAATIPRAENGDAKNEFALADAISSFNAENKQLGRGLDQPALTEDEVIAVIKLGQWKRGNPQSLNEKEIAAFKAIAESKRLPKGSYLDVHTEEQSETFRLKQLWQVRLMIPAIGHDGFVGLTIRNTLVAEEKIDPKDVAWGKADAEGLSLGAYLSPRKAQYVFGECVRLRLFVRNDGAKAVKATWANTSHPMPDDYTVTDTTGAKVAVYIGHESWSLPWISGYTDGGALPPGATHALFVPYEISIGPEITYENGIPVHRVPVGQGIGGDGPNKLIGRVIAARPGQTLQLKVRAHNGNDRERKEGEAVPESDFIAFDVADKGNAADLK